MGMINGRELSEKYPVLPRSTGHWHCTLCPKKDAEIARLQIALRESVMLQSHYAELLNQYDGGERRGFVGPEDWMKRLKEIGKIA